MGLFEDFMNGNATVSAITYKDIELKLKAVELSLQNVARAILYKNVFNDDLARTDLYTTVTIADVAELEKNIDASLSFAGYMDHSAGKNLTLAKHQSAAYVSTTYLQQFAAHTMDFMLTRNVSSFFKNLPPAKEPRKSFIKTNSLLQTMINAMIEVNFQKADIGEKLVAEARELAAQIPNMSTAFNEARQKIKEHLRFCYNEESTLLTFSTHLTDFTPL